MNSFLLDGQALGKRFVPERGTPLIDHLFTRCPPPRLLCALVAALDVVAEFVRRRQLGLFTPSLFSAAMLQLRWNVLQPASMSKLPIDNPLIERALTLVDRYELSAVDALVLQSALDGAARLRPAADDLVLVSPDPRVLQAARSEGLQTFDPESQTQTDLDALLGP
jgi:hypothetical protein